MDITVFIQTLTVNWSLNVEDIKTLYTIWNCDVASKVQISVKYYLLACILTNSGTHNAARNYEQNNLTRPRDDFHNP